MNHYAILGVAPNATDDVIKRAYQMLAQRAHPDKKGGNKEKFQQIQAAYDVLSDPIKRKHYDASGESNLPPPFDIQVRNEAFAAIAAALGSPGGGDLLETTKRMVQDKLNQCTVGSQNLRQQRDRLRKERERIKVKGDAPNLFHMVIDQQLADAELKLEQNYKADDLLSAVIKLLEDYEREPDKMHNLLGSTTGVSTAFEWKAL